MEKDGKKEVTAHSISATFASLRAGLTWLGEVEARSRYIAATIDGEFEGKQELEVGTRQDVWDEARDHERVFGLCNILHGGIHRAGNSQSKRSEEHRLHRYQGVRERGGRNNPSSRSFIVGCLFYHGRQDLSCLVGYCLWDTNA